MAEIVLLDVNETLLDTGALDPWFERHFGKAAARESWFMQLEVLWLVTIATGKYQDFPTLAQAAAEIGAKKEGVDLTASHRQELLDTVKRLPAHPEAGAALTRLREGGLRLAALTNGTLDAARTQLERAGLDDHFEAIFSADEVERFKPAPEPYVMALERLGAKPGDAWMVAAHAWDIAGAAAAGLRTAFVERPRKILNPAGPSAISAADLLEVAAGILGKQT